MSKEPTQQDWRAALGALVDSAELKAAAEDSSAAAECEPRQTARLDVVVERKGRGGKVATIVTGFTISDSAIEAVAADLKRSLGTGGSARGGEILIQGDRADRVVEALTRMGFKARKI